MSNYTFFFRGGKPKSAAEGRARQPRWNEWFSSLGDKVVDPGAAARSLGIAGSAPGYGDIPVSTGYAIISASSDDEAMKLATTCPIYTEGGFVEVARTVPAQAIMAA